MWRSHGDDVICGCEWMRNWCEWFAILQPPDHKCVCKVWLFCATEQHSCWESMGNGASFSYSIPVMLNHGRYSRGHLVDHSRRRVISKLVVVSSSDLAISTWRLNGWTVCVPAIRVLLINAISSINKATYIHDFVVDEQAALAYIWNLPG